MHNKTIKFNNKHLEIKYRNDSDLSVINEIFVDKMYRSVEEIIKNAKNPILDIGAHIGLFSTYASVLNSNAQIIALEPEPSNFTLMKENLKLNHCKNVLCKQVALIAGEESEVKLQLSENSHNHTTSPDHLITKSPNHMIVSAINLEKLIKQHAVAKAMVGKMGLLKMDIEGAEFEIIKAIKQKNIKTIETMAIEYHENEKHKRAELENILRNNGFSIEHFPNHYDKRFGLLVCRNRS